jgi:glycosyltransferase involved in cell wall biosynthesis
LGIPLDAPLIGTVGRIDHQKAPEDMLAAYVALGRPDTWFVWIGDGPLSGRLAREVSRRGLNDRFLIVGERADVGELLPGLDVFAMASLFEGLPCALVEAMTCGIPVVASAVNGVPDVVHAGKTGLLAPPRAPETLSRAIAYLLDHPEHARLMATAARAEVQGRFDPERLGQDLMETYERALADRLQSRLYRVSAA